MAETKRITVLFATLSPPPPFLSESELDESVIDVVEVVEVVEDELPDVDKECADDPFQSPIYAYDIFQYYKVR